MSLINEPKLYVTTDSGQKVWIRTIGAFSFSGLSTDFLVTTKDITDSASKLPDTILSTRNSLCIHNLDENETLFIGKNNAITADRVTGTTSGWEIGPGGEFFIDVGNFELWAIAPTGKTIQVKILEIA